LPETPLARVVIFYQDYINVGGHGSLAYLFRMVEVEYLEGEKSQCLLIERRKVYTLEGRNGKNESQNQK
jgi:hypothetical protein